MRIYHLPLFMLTGLLLACVAAPVQEMSDARQAIESAAAAGADGYTNVAMRDARRLIDQALRAMENRRYRDARMLALEAKTKAVSARIIVLQESLYPEAKQAE